jgi:hypothetical protein
VNCKPTQASFEGGKNGFLIFDTLPADVPERASGWGAMAFLHATEGGHPTPVGVLLGGWLRVRTTVTRHPLPIALLVQALLLFHRLDLLEPWGDEYFTLNTVPQSFRQIAAVLGGNPPLYFFLLHMWLWLPWAGNPVVASRAFSAMWAIFSTGAIYWLWLRKEAAATQRWFLTLWTLSPCLLLYARMARSYSMQLFFGCLTIYAAGMLLRQPWSRRWLFAYGLSCCTLFYTHYLPGVAIHSSVCISLLYKIRGGDKRAPAIALVGSSLLIGFLYLPWISAFYSAIRDWQSVSQVYRVGNLFVDQAVRITYWIVSFTVGEAVSTPVLVLGALLIPVAAYSLWRAMAAKPEWLPLLAVSCLVAYVGADRWSGYPFTSLRMLFALPFFLLLLVRGFEGTPQRGAVLCAAFAVLYCAADVAYFTKTGYLNQGYCSPYKEMAAVINDNSPQSGAVVVVDGLNSVPQPLLDDLPKQDRVIVLGDATEADSTRRELQADPNVVWVWRHTHDTSPGHYVTRLAEDLSTNRDVRRHLFLPYSGAERRVLSLLRGPGQPAYFYELLELHPRK